MKVGIFEIQFKMGRKAPSWTPGPVERLVNGTGFALPAGLGVVVDYTTINAAGTVQNFKFGTGAKDNGIWGLLATPAAVAGPANVIFAGFAPAVLSLGVYTVGMELTATGSGTSGVLRARTAGERLFAYAAENITIGGATGLSKVIVVGGGNPGSAPLVGTVANTAFTAGAVAANSMEEKTATVAGLFTGAPISVNPPLGPTTAGCQMVACRVSALDTLAVTFANVTGGGLAIPVGNYIYRVERQ
jgi:hypothetical protein